jgi:uncharacterized protein (TIGR02001 family)
MKKLLLTTAAAVVLSTGLASAADLRMVGKAPAPPPPAPSMWDIAFGGALATDYNFRGISQSDRGPSVFGYWEPRFNINPNFQLYAGIAGASVKLPTDPAAEIDFYGGVRATFGKFTADLGAIYYYYPKEREIDGVFITAPPVFNTTLTDTDFWEVYAKLNYTWTDEFSTGLQAYYSPSWLNSGADGTFLVGNAKYTLPWKIPVWGGVGVYMSGEFGHYWFGRTDVAFTTTGVVVFLDNTGTTGIDLPDYNYWSGGFGFTWKTFTLDFRYYDTDLSGAECNALTADPGASVIAPTVINNFTTFGSSRWCSEAFVARLSWDLTLDSLK